jgi:iron(III) transport system substrate-binding protein
MRMLFGVLAAIAVLWSGAAAAEEVNIYSSRHYDTDQALYDEFKAQTGIKVNVIEGSGDELIERIRSEGENSPADILITVDAGRLWRAEAADIFQPIESAKLEAAIPPHLRHPDGLWFGFSKRARVIVYNRNNFDPSVLSTYEALADEKFRDMLCVRSSTSVYNQSLLGSIIAADGEAAAENWVGGLVANFARPPQGNDRAQISAVAAGECALGIVNTYYIGKMLNSPKQDERAAAAKVAVFFPNQGGRGTHVNISGGGVVRGAPHREAAIRFLEYLATPQAQAYFANGNFEYPVIEGVAPHPDIAALGAFREDTLNASVIGANNPEALMIADRAGWK